MGHRKREAEGFASLLSAFRGVQGLIKEYDEAAEAVARTTEKLESLLVKVQKALGAPGLKFAHSKFRYEVECADSLAKEVQRRLGGEVTSTKKGFIRHALQRSPG